ncbi:MAG: DNA repair protein RecN [Dehalococcoidales bacterium]|nr:DNA repair protein RecN [Dehalococcoidales bacterium]
MLLELRVKDFGIIEDINWNLSEGLNVITGETGAGKSLVIDAVEALLSGKIEEENIRYGSDGTFIEGLFAFPDKKASFDSLKSLLEENGLSCDDGMLVISCELKKQGRSVIRINRRAVPRSLLSQVGAYLVDIHGQSDHLSLLNTEYHIDFLDSYAHTLDLRQKFASLYSELLQAESELESLAKADKDTSAQEELLRFQADEIKKAKLVDGEDAELEQELKIISASEQLKASSFEVYSMLNGEDSASSSIPALEALNWAVRIVGRLVELDPSLKPELAMLEGVVPDVEEVARSIRNYSENMEFDAGRLAEIEDRLELIRNLKRKYGQSVPEILSYLEGIESKLGRFSNSAERIEELKKQSASLRQELGKLGCELSNERRQAAKKLIEQVNSELADLKMEQVKFDVSIMQKKSANGIPSPDGENYEFSRRGVDFIEFMAATNPGEPFKPLVKIASTGEISRFMLALKGAFSKTDNIPILVFDEIDIGVGGRCGEVIGEKLWSLARGRQVLCITHLPQIAVFADAHHAIRKNTDGSRASTTLESLTGDALISELTVMLVGSQSSESSVNSVKELMQKAMDWKQGNRKLI